MKRKFAFCSVLSKKTLDLADEIISLIYFEQFWFKLIGSNQY